MGLPYSVWDIRFFLYQHSIVKKMRGVFTLSFHLQYMQAVEFYTGRLARGFKIMRLASFNCPFDIFATYVERISDANFFYVSSKGVSNVRIYDIYKISHADH